MISEILSLQAFSLNSAGHISKKFFKKLMLDMKLNMDFVVSWTFDKLKSRLIDGNRG